MKSSSFYYLKSVVIGNKIGLSYLILEDIYMCNPYLYKDVIW